MCLHHEQDDTLNLRATHMPGQSNSVLKRVYRALLKRCVRRISLIFISVSTKLLLPVNVQMGSMLHCRAVGFDQRPFLRFLICKHSPLLEQDLHSIVDAYLGGRDFYVPSPLLPQSVFEATRVACRFPVSPLHLNTDQKDTIAIYGECMCCQHSTWRMQMLSAAATNSLTLDLTLFRCITHHASCAARRLRQH